MRKKIKILFIIAIALLSIQYARLIKKTIAPQLPAKGSFALLYSNQCRQNLSNSLAHGINRAKKSIFVVMFGLTDNTMLTLLEKKARSGIDVKIFYDPRSSKEINIKNAQCYPIERAGLMHQKILIIDESLIFLGSTNLTRASLSMHNNLLVGINNPEMAKFLIKKAPFSPGMFNTMVKGQDMELWLLPDRKMVALEKLVNLIKGAKRNIKVAMFTLTHPVLVDEIIKAKKRGVTISIIIDYHSSFGASAKAIKKLKDNKVSIKVKKGPELMHHKYLFIDNKILACGSANWTKAAFTRNKDLLLIVYNLKPFQRGFMNKLHNILEIQTY